MIYVFFDLDETLIETIKTNREIFKNIRRSTGVKISDLKFRNIFRTILRKNMLKFMDYDYNESVGIDPIDYYFEDEDYNHGDLKAFKDVNYNELKQILSADFGRDEFEKTAHNGAELYTITKPGVLEAISYIRYYVKVGIITNGTHTAQWKKLKAANLIEKVDDIFVSGDFGLGKPNPKFYNYIIEKTNCNPARSFMIGDNIQSDYFGSLAAGFNPIYFSKQKVPYNVVRATNAEEILNIVRPIIFSSI